MGENNIPIVTPQSTAIILQYVKLIHTAMPEEISFNSLPHAVAQLLTKLNHIEKLLSEKSNSPHYDSDRWFDLDELVRYDPEKRSKPTFYGYVHRQEIPYHKRGRKLIFLKSEIDQWLKGGRRKTIEEIEEEAFFSLNSKKRGGKK